MFVPATITFYLGESVVLYFIESNLFIKPIMFYLLNINTLKHQGIM